MIRKIFSFLFKPFSDHLTVERVLEYKQQTVVVPDLVSNFNLISGIALRDPVHLSSKVLLVVSRRPNV